MKESFNSKTILILTPSLSGGGAERLAANLSLELSKNHSVIVATFENVDKEYPYGGKRINLDIGGGNVSIVRKIINALKRIHKIKKIKTEFNVDYSISFLPQTDYVNVLSKKKRTKAIVDVVSNMSFVYPRGISRIFREKILKKADHVVTVSEGARQDLIQNFNVDPLRATTIYNSCDVSFIKKACCENNSFLCPDRFIVTMGSFRHPKGHWHLLKAYSCILKKDPSIKLIILGDGDYRKKYLELMENLGIPESSVIMPGFLRNPFTTIAKAELFVFSSVFEGFGNAIIEAMACGVPVLSTDCDFGPREILAPGTDLLKKANSLENVEFGYLVPPFDMSDIDVSSIINSDEEAFGDSILRALSNDNSSLIQKGLSRCEDFDNKGYGKKWLETIEKI